MKRWLISLCALIMLLLCSCGKEMPARDELARLTAAAMEQYYLTVSPDYSEATVEAFAEAYSELAEIYGDLPELNATDADAVLTLGLLEELLLEAACADGTAVEEGLMKPFPQNCSDIDRDYVLHIPELPEIAATFAEKMSRRGDEPAEKDADTLYKRLEAEAADAPAVKRINVGGDLSWFVTQHDGSEDSKINCMPAIACMAIRRFTAKTPEPDELRRETNADGTWYLHNVSEAVARYGVDCDIAPLSEDGIIAALDSGKMLLMKCSYADTDRISHCMAVFGYERRGNGIRFLCADPDKSETEILPAYYVMYIAERCTSRMLICG